jgi:hypothetical protein
VPGAHPRTRARHRLVARPRALSPPPLQEANASVVAAAALALRESELGGAVASLSVDECELLLKYVYRALAKPSEKSAAWLKWHATLLERTGPGAIVRVITEMGSTV